MIEIENMNVAYDSAIKEAEALQKSEEQALVIKLNDIDLDFEEKLRELEREFEEKK